MSEPVVEAIEEMLWERARNGNAQSRYGEEAAFRFEVFRFVEALNKLLDNAP